MKDRINTEHVMESARATAADVAGEMLEIHGPLWESQENLAKLVVSLSSTMLVGSITFSGNIVGSNVSEAICPKLLVISWMALFLTLFFAILSLWFSVSLKSFRIRLLNAEPALEESSEKLDPSLAEDELKQQILSLVMEYADTATKPVGKADSGARYTLNASLGFFGLGVGLFLWFGAIQIT